MQDTPQSLDLRDAQHDPFHSPVSFMDTLHCVQSEGRKSDEGNLVVAASLLGGSLASGSFSFSLSIVPFSRISGFAAASYSSWLGYCLS